jgi:UDP-N-acetylglucosamine--N-acetylmuramyl-(pentapeptide) pyrophosphoryl-undecaprenol N-acetylglucosamine transferase
VRISGGNRVNLSMGNFSILITGGGTGGHIFPGISLYDEFKEKGIRTFMLVGKKDVNFSPLLKIDSKGIFSYRVPSFTKNILLLPIFIMNFSRAVLKAMMLIKRLKTDAVIGMGGYVSAPALVAAVILKVPVYLCEQNSVPGKVTSAFASRAKKIFTTLNVTTDYFKKDAQAKVVHAGNPLRKEVITKAGREESKKFFHLGHCKKVILVIGGSQGALQINELFLEVKKIYSKELKDVGIIWATGEYSYKKFKDLVEQKGSNGSVYLLPFIDEVGMAYKASDLVISRAGAGGIMEFAATGLPSILIPYPNAAMDHQKKNAEVFEKAGASVRIRKEESDPEKLGNIIVDLLSNSNQLARMSGKARSLAKNNASKDIVDNIIKDLNSAGGDVV